MLAYFVLFSIYFLPYKRQSECVVYSTYEGSGSPLATQTSSTFSETLYDISRPDWSMIVGGLPEPVARCTPLVSHLTL